MIGRDMYHYIYTANEKRARLNTSVITRVLFLKNKDILASIAYNLNITKLFF
jgi:hypothetical protein